MDGADLPVKRRFDMGNIGSMHSLDLDYDNSMMGVEVDGYGDGNLRRVQGKAPKSRPGPVYSKSPLKDEYTEVNGIMVRSPKIKAIRSPEPMLSCAQCGDEAPSANGCIDQDDNQWYCNSCWRGLEDVSSLVFTLYQVYSGLLFSTCFQNDLICFIDCRWMDLKRRRFCPRIKTQSLKFCIIIISLVSHPLFKLFSQQMASVRMEMEKSL